MGNLWRDGIPKYYEFKIARYYLYFTSHCVIECMHVHASDRKLTESGSAKFFVRENGDTVLQNRGILNDREINIFLKRHRKPRRLRLRGVSVSNMDTSYLLANWHYSICSFKCKIRFCFNLASILAVSVPQVIYFVNQNETCQSRTRPGSTCKSIHF